MTPVTAHFAVAEFGCRDGTAYPRAWVAPRLRPLCEVLEVLRGALGDTPVAILSGYRTPAYNALVGGASRSQHLAGRAADITAFGVPARTVHDTLLALHRAGAIRIGGLGRYAKFTHVDIRPGELRQWSA